MSETSFIRITILREAALHFGEHGYGGDSLRVLASSPVVQKSARGLFGSSEELAREAFDFAVGAVNAHVEGALSRQSNEVDQLLALVTVFVELLKDPELTGGCPAFGPVRLGQAPLPFVRESTREAVSHWRRVVRRIVRRGIRRESVHPAADPEEVGSVIIAAIEGAAVLHQLYNDPIHLDRSAAYLSRYLNHVVRFQ